MLQTLFILLLLMLPLFCPLAYSDDSSKTDQELMPQALSWKYGEFGSTENGRVTDWIKPEPQPSYDDMDKALSDYKQKLIDDATAKKDRKKGVLAKLKLDESDIKALKELLQDGTSD
jgi:hypothetical protein